MHRIIKKHKGMCMHEVKLRKVQNSILESKIMTKFYIKFKFQGVKG